MYHRIMQILINAIVKAFTAYFLILRVYLFSEVSVHLSVDKLLSLDIRELKST